MSLRSDFESWKNMILLAVNNSVKRFPAELTHIGVEEMVLIRKYWRLHVVNRNASGNV